MYEMAKKGREAMKNRAKQLAGEKNMKVDSSDWTPAEPLKADVKTGMRPVSPRAFKRGGKVCGGAAEKRADRKARGGSTPSDKASYEPAMSKGNQENARAAYEEGRTPKKNGGPATDLKAAYAAGEARAAKMGKDASAEEARKQVEALQNPKRLQEMGRKSGGKAEYSIVDRYINRDLKKANELREGEKHVGGMKKGGRTGKDGGGGVLGTIKSAIKRFAGPSQAEKLQENLKDVGKGQPTDYSTGDRNAIAEKANEAARKSGGRTKKMDGDALRNRSLNTPAGQVIPGSDFKKGGKVKHAKPEPTKSIDKGGKRAKLIAAMPNMKEGGRAERKAGGRTKGKTNINIVIQAGQKPAAPDMGMAPPPPMPGGIPMPAPGQQAAAPMPMPVPGPAMPPMGGGVPMPRKTGGRVAKSYKDMTAGAASGMGRLQKTAIERSQRVRGA